MRAVGWAAAAVMGTVGLAAIAGTPEAAALPACTTIAPQTTQCERGTHVGINSSPAVTTSSAPFLERPWLYPRYPVVGMGGWAIPWA